MPKAVAQKHFVAKMVEVFLAVLLVSVPGSCYLVDQFLQDMYEDDDEHGLVAKFVAKARRYARRVSLSTRLKL